MSFTIRFQFTFQNAHLGHRMCFLGNASYQTVENDSKTKSDYAKQDISNFPHGHPHPGIPRTVKSFLYLVKIINAFSFHVKAISREFISEKSPNLASPSFPICHIQQEC